MEKRIVYYQCLYHVQVKRQFLFFKYWYTIDSFVTLQDAEELYMYVNEINSIFL